MDRPFHNVYSHGFVRAAVCIPSVRVADPAYNAERTLGLARRAHELHAAVALFPELGISAYSNDDLFHQSALLDGTVQALARVVRESTRLMPVLLVGAPLLFEGKLFNCAVVIHRGRVLGIVPKSYLPNYRELRIVKRVQDSDPCFQRFVKPGHQLDGVFIGHLVEAYQQAARTCVEKRPAQTEDAFASLDVAKSRVTPAQDHQFGAMQIHGHNVRGCHPAGRDIGPWLSSQRVGTCEEDS